MIAIDGSIANAWFVVAAGASGSHSVAVSYDMGRQVSAPVGFSTDCPGGEAAVGGVVMPVNALAVLAPWLAVIGLVDCIGAAAVAVRRVQRS